jgi:hypothetical protein
MLRLLLRGSILAMLILPTGHTNDAQAQVNKSDQSGGTTTTDAGAHVTLAGVEFWLRSATLGPEVGGRVSLRLTIAATNTNDVPIGMFVMATETSASIDTGAVFNGPAMTVSGIGKCPTASRDYCIKEKNSIMVTVPHGVTDNIIMEIPLGRTVTSDMRSSLTAATTVDLSAVFCLMSGDNNSTFAPPTFAGQHLRNMIH